MFQVKEIRKIVFPTPTWSVLLRDLPGSLSSVRRIIVFIEVVESQCYYYWWHATLPLSGNYGPSTSTGELPLARHWLCPDQVESPGLSVG